MAPGDPIDPASLDAMKQAADIMSTEIVNAINKGVSSTHDLSKAWKDLRFDLMNDLKTYDDIENKLKLIVTATKTIREGIRMGNKDTQTSADMLKKLVEGHQELQKGLQKEGRLYKESEKAVRDINALWEILREKSKNFKDNIKLSDDDLQKFNDTLAGTVTLFSKANKLAKGIAEMGPKMQKMADVMQAYASFGMGKGMAGKIEKFSSMGQAAAKIRAAQEARYESNPKFKAKREAAAQEMTDKYGPNWVKDVYAQREIAKKSGIGWLRRRKLEKTGQLGVFAGGETSPEIARAMTGGGGENTLAALGDAIGKIAPLLAAAGGAIELLIKAFDFYVKQNKDMEGALAKGGLFGAVSPMDAFEGMRQILTPTLDAFDGLVSSLGLTWERNLKMAQAMTEGGMNLSAYPKAAGVRNPWDTNKEFGPGTFGQIQKTAAVGGRLAGLTDAESIQRILMMADQYRETLEGSADFFSKVKKDTAAAGISYTKYISIVDEVMGHFTRLNKVFDQTMTLLAELSKTGRVGAENLKEYMDWLTGGAGAGEQGTPAQGFLLSNMSQDERERQARNRRTEYEVAAGRAPTDLGKIKGFTEGQIRQGLSEDQTPEQMQNFLGKMTTAMKSSGMDAQAQKSAQDYMDNLIKLRQNIGPWESFAKDGDVVKLMMALKVSGATEQNSMALNSAALSTITKGPKEGRKIGDLKDLVHDPQEYVRQHPEVIGMLQTEGIKDPDKFLNNLRPMQRLSAEGAIEEAAGNKKSAENLLSVLKGTGFAPDLQGGTAQSFFEKNKGNQGVIDALMGTQEMVDRWQNVAAKGREREAQAVKDKEDKDARELAKRTQDSADAIKNALSTYFTRIINAVEFIANSYIFRGTPMNLSDNDVANLRQASTENDTDIAKLNARITELTGKKELTPEEQKELEADKQTLSEKNTLKDQLASAITSKMVIGDAPKAAIDAILQTFPGYKKNTALYTAPLSMETTGVPNPQDYLSKGLPAGPMVSRSHLSTVALNDIAAAGYEGGGAAANITYNTIIQGFSPNLTNPPNNSTGDSTENRVPAGVPVQTDWQQKRAAAQAKQLQGAR